MTDDLLRIFISYRRGETRGFVGWLASSLEAVLPAGRVFRDVESLGVGDWKRAIDENIRLAGVVLCVLGDRWLTITQPDSDRRRLDAMIHHAVDQGVRVSSQMYGTNFASWPLCKRCR
jgi:hypothetical protein